MARSCLCRRDLLVFVLALWLGASVVASFSLPQVTISPFGSDETGSGSSSNPFKTLSKAISVLEPGGTVWMASGVYSGADNFISQSDAMTIRSVDPTSPAVLACVGGYSGYLNLAENFTASDIIFAGCETIVTIQYPATYNFVNCIFNNLGSANECEGGIAMNPSPGIYMWFENCTFVNNSLAVFMNDGNATFVGCTFQNNQVAVTVTPGTAVFENCLFQNNTGGMGSDCLFTPDWGVAQSVLNNNGVMRISNCSFESNSSPGNGGAVLNDDGILLVSDSQFVSNTAGEGGALYLSSASILKAQNVLFMNNTATSQAGAIGCDSSGDTVTLTSCQSTNNSPPDNCPENSFL